MAPPTIILGVTGSIAAYKALLLTRQLRERGMSVHPIMTQGAQRFVGELSFTALAGNETVTDMWSASSQGAIGHVELAHLASAFVIAPATADVLARLVLGRADDPLCAVALATRAPMIIAPAMETGMWEHPQTQANLETLRAWGATIVEPSAGALASGRSGMGRMAEPEHIVDFILRALRSQDLAGKRVLVTAGPTREPFDPVRFVSNPSSGKMGFALARAAWMRGATVTLIAGPNSLSPLNSDIEVTPIQTTQEMLDACRAALPGTDVFIMAAAPVDFRPTTFSTSKLKKDQTAQHLNVEFTPNPDILGELGPRATGVFTVGFAAETGQLVSHARKKLQGKDLDLIVANDVTRPDAGFGVDTNAVTLIGRTGEPQNFPSAPKEEVAHAILDRAKNPHGS